MCITTVTLIVSLIRKNMMLVGIDVGGTKTHIAVADSTGIDHQVIRTDAWQHRQLHDPDDVSRLLALARTADLDQTTDALAIGAHGCDSAAQIGQLREAIRVHWQGPLTVVNDADLLGPACGLTDSIAVVVGTGSIVVGHRPDGAVVQVGGHGWLLDDFGSAPGIVREAVLAVSRALDRPGPRDRLADCLIDFYAAADERELMLTFIQRAGISYWGDAAATVFEAADRGSPLAIEVVEAAAAQLVAQIRQAQRLGAIGATVVLAGGVVVNQPRLVEAIDTRLRATGPELHVQVLRDPPVLGALELARRLLHPPSSLDPVNHTKE